MSTFVVLILVGNFLLCDSGSILRNKRGYLSRTGLCAKPEENFKLRDPRLNFWGVAYVLPDDANPKCSESECSEDSHCDADRKCCKNHCGGMVCTPTTRDPNPCKKFQCPTGQTCKVQYVPCVMPKCKDAIAINRPTCIKDLSVTAPTKPSNPTAAPEAAPYGPQTLAQTPMYPQQAGYQQPESQYPQPMAGFQNDDPEAKGTMQGALAGDQSNLETDLNDAALQNDNQPLTFQNENPPTREDANFFQPPADGQQPVDNGLVSQFPADITSSAPQRAWDRSSKFQ